ncbi:MAG: hypothetical protein SFU86_05170 [Pirellulaceae bacterium]|nr:hypothetical protein [Pirellulaceae bacterium]
MIAANSNPPTERSFANAWGELDYLCRKTRYWLYGRRQPARAERYLSRLQGVLRRLPKGDVAILRAEGLALRDELEGKIEQAIAHRRLEIELMQKLHAEARASRYSDQTREYLLQGRDLAALAERRAILAALESAKAKPRRRLVRSA